MVIISLSLSLTLSPTLDSNSRKRKSKRKISSRDDGLGGVRGLSSLRELAITLKQLIKFPNCESVNTATGLSPGIVKGNNSSPRVNPQFLSSVILDLQRQAPPIGREDEVTLSNVFVIQPVVSAPVRGTVARFRPEAV
jgi:hypothetical protein